MANSRWVLRVGFGWRVTAMAAWIAAVGVASQASDAVGVAATEPTPVGRELIVDGERRTFRATPRPPVIRVATWNVDLWRRGNEGHDGYRRGQKAEDFRKWFEQMDADVVLLQEVAADAGWNRNRLLGEALDGLPGRWKHVVFELDEIAPSRQRTGVAWRSDRVTLMNGPVGWRWPVAKGVVESTGDTAWRRTPHAMHFSAGPGLTDFLVINTHMRSNWGGDHQDQRTDETRELLAAMGTMRRMLDGERDIVVYGRLFEEHREASTGLYETRGFRDLNPDDKPTLMYSVRDPAARDFSGGWANCRAFVPADQPEFAQSTFGVWGTDALGAMGLTPHRHHATVSDYLPAYFELRIMPDDD
ncbi:MAG: hypothetical protein AAFX76_06355 [Planctomycetota bacterium]